MAGGAARHGRAMPAFDLVVIADPRPRYAEGRCLAALLATAARAGYRTALLPVLASLPTPAPPFHPAVAALLAGGEVTLLDGERPHDAALALVYHLLAVRDPAGRPLRLRAGQVVLRVDQPWRRPDGTALVDPRAAVGNAGALLGAEPEVVGGDRLLSEALGVGGVWPVVSALPRRARVTSALHRLGCHIGGGLALSASLGTLELAEASARSSSGPRPPELADPAAWLGSLDAYVLSPDPARQPFLQPGLAEVLAVGTPLMAPPGFEPLLGPAALYMAPKDLAALTPERRLELAEAAADFHARTTSPDALLRRLGERIGRPAVRAPALRLRREARSRRRAIFLSPNGIGMGHLTRLLAVARRCSADLEPVFLSMSQAVGVVREWGYVAEYFPYHAHTGETADAWNAALRARLEEAIAFYDARCVVFDGNVPYQGLTACRRAHPDRAFVWIRRGLWRAEAGRAAIERSRHFDLVVEPGELAASLDVGATAGRRDETVQVPPVLLLDAEELLDRDAARAELGLDPGRTAVLVQLGSRNNFDYAAIDQAILDELGGRPDVELVHVDWLIGEAEPELPPRVRRLRTFPVTRYLRAFDLAVSAVGYNSFHELLAFGVPSIFVPNENPIMDAQELRAAWAERHGLALAVGRRDPYRMVRALRSLLDPATRAEISARCAALPRMDGAAQVARHIDQLSAAVRA